MRHDSGDGNGKLRLFKVGNVVIMKERPILVQGREYSRGQIARETGLSVSHVSRIFSGRRSPSLNTARVLAQFFRVTIDELYQGLFIDKPRLENPSGYLQIEHEQGQISA